MHQRWREYFDDVLNPLELNDLDANEVIQPWETEALTASGVATTIKQFKLRKTAGGDKIRPEMFKSLSLGSNSLVNKSVSTSL